MNIIAAHFIGEQKQNNHLGHPDRAGAANLNFIWPKATALRVTTSQSGLTNGRADHHHVPASELWRPLRLASPSDGQWSLSQSHWHRETRAVTCRVSLARYRQRCKNTLLGLCSASSNQFGQPQAAGPPGCGPGST
jgi:hypothetical protein